MREHEEYRSRRSCRTKRRLLGCNTQVTSLTLRLVTFVLHGCFLPSPSTLGSHRPSLTLCVFQGRMNRLSSRLRAPKLPSVHDLPVITSPNKHIVTFKKQYPSGPQIQQVRLKYPYMSAQTLADSVSLHCQTNKSSQVLAGLTQALGNVATGKLARPVTGIKITIGGVTHVEKNKTTVVQFMRGSLALGNRDKKKTTRHGKMGIRTTQVTLCSAAFPF